MTPWYCAHEALWLNLDHIGYIRDERNEEDVPYLVLFGIEDAAGDYPLPLCTHDSAELRDHLIGMVTTKQRRRHFEARPKGQLIQDN